MIVESNVRCARLFNGAGGDRRRAVRSHRRGYLEVVAAVALVHNPSYLRMATRLARVRQKPVGRARDEPRRWRLSRLHV
jgi:hypothetical protein